MSKLRNPIVQTRRDAWVEINIGNIEHNIKELKKLTVPITKFLAVVKADAYGHDSTMIAPTLVASGVDVLGVATIDEGIQLRNSGITAPILVLGSAPAWSFESAIENDIQLSIFTNEHIEACIKNHNKTGKKAVVQIKVDTGMNRIGINHKSASEFISKVIDTPEIKLEGIFTHLACAENDEISKEQNSKWQKITEEFKDLNAIFHCVNTSGLIGFPEMHYDMVRAGIGIYGLMPELHSNAPKIPNLKQVLGLKGRIAHIHETEKESGISYGHTYKTKKETKVATIPIGYADGISRKLSNKICGIVNGQKVKQIGNITMDQMMFDISEVKNINTGDIITILGEDSGQEISINEWAEILNTINYEITCRLKVRLPRVYTR